MSGASLEVPPLRVLLVAAAPRDLPRYDADGIVREVQAALQPLAARGTIVLERATPATEAELKRRLAEGPWHVVHFVGHARARATAQYATLALESSDGAARQVNASYFASTLASNPALRLVVLQACDSESAALEPLAAALVERGIEAVLTTGPRSGKELGLFVSKLHAAVLATHTAEEALAELRTALSAGRFDAASLRLVRRSPNQALFARATAATSAPSAGPPAPAPKPAREDARVAARAELERKRALGRFDVFLCHNVGDKPAVKRIAQRLQAAGILPWLDEWELTPGQPWQVLLEQHIASIRSAAVFVGTAGVGPWQEQEILAFLREFVSRKSPVIPVLLEDAPQAPALPLFLRAMTWVDFRTTDPDPLERLVWGITGERPKHRP